MNKTKPRKPIHSWKSSVLVMGTQLRPGRLYWLAADDTAFAPSAVLADTPPLPEGPLPPAPPDAPLTGDASAIT